MQPISAKSRERELADNGNVASNVVFTLAAVVFTKGDIKNPVRAFQAPVSTRCKSKLLHGFDPGAYDEVAPFNTWLPLGFLAGFNHADCRKFLPRFTHRITAP